MNVRRETGDVLLLTRGLLDTGWCRGAFARDAHGRPCNADNPQATKWCLTGAVKRAVTETRSDANVYWRSMKELDRASRDIFGKSPATVNDVLARDVDDVLMVVDAALNQVDDHEVA